MTSHRFPALRGILAVVRLLPRVSRPRTAAFVATTVAVAALPLAATVATGLLIGLIPAAIAGGPDVPETRSAYLLLGVVAAALVLHRLVQHLHNANARNLGRELLLQDRLVTAVGRPEGIAHLENEEVLSLLRIARQLGMDYIRPERAVQGLAAVAPDFLAAFGASIVLVVFNVGVGLAWLLA